MINKSYFYFNVELTTRTSPAVIISHTDFFPIKKAILYFDEYNERPRKSNPTKHQLKKYRYSADEVYFPEGNIKNVIRISKDDFDFFAEEREPCFVIE
jgi:hypothetical protein